MHHASLLWCATLILVSHIVPVVNHTVLAIVCLVSYWATGLVIICVSCHLNLYVTAVPDVASLGYVSMAVSEPRQWV